MQHLSLSRPQHGGNLAWAATLTGVFPHQILDFSASINPLGPPQSAIAAIQHSLLDLRHYPDPDYRQFRQVLSRVHHLSADWILPGNGAAELLTWACRELAELPQTGLLIPTFGDYRRALSAFSAPVVACSFWAPLMIEPVNLDAAIFAAMPQPKGCGLLLNNPHNPTGRLFSKADILPLLSQFALVVIDEAFMDFLPDAEQQSLIDQVVNYPNLVILRSLTKFYSLPGLRIGYAIAHPDRLRRWQQWRDPWCVNSLAVVAAEAALADTAFQQQTLAWLPPARAHLEDGLSRIPGLTVFPGAANYVLVQAQTSVPDLQKTVLQRSQVLIRDCMSFAELGDRYFRVAVRTEPDHQRLLDGLAQGMHDDA